MTREREWVSTQQQEVRSTAVEARATTEAQPTPARAGLLTLQRTVGNRAVGHLMRRRPIQARLAVNEPGDQVASASKHEREADRIADRVLAAPADRPVSEAPIGIQRLAEPPAGRMGEAPAPGSQGFASVDRVLAGPSRPLEPALRQDMEERFGHDFSDVRVHADAAAEQSARDVNALAYTAGSDIVFGAGQFTPGTPGGRRLIAHELTHVVQQSAAGSKSTARLQRQPAGASTQPAAGSATQVVGWADLWDDFTFAKISRSAADATAIAVEMAETPGDWNELMKHGLAVVAWLRDHGQPDAAARLLERVRAAFTIAWATDQPIPPIVMGDVFPLQGNPLDMAKDAARAGKHDEAFRLLGTAHEILSIYVLRTTEQRQAGDLTRTLSYYYLDRIYDKLRAIYEFYFVLEREALAAGDAAQAATARAKATELATLLKQEYSFADQPAAVVEASSVTTSKGAALRLEGANAVTTDLTVLPGLPPTREIGEGIKLESLGVVQDALVAQAQFQAEIGREPEIAQEFGTTPIDLSNTQQRQKVWGIMLGVYDRAGSGALGRLMVLIGKYLKAFTTHTEYNVRDLGANYLTSQFPIDLTGRATMDCGVYALSVAWDTYQAVKQGKVKRDVTFRLVAFLDHVSLIIDDKTGGEFFVVNNNQITAVKADPEREAQKEYGEMRGFLFLITPSYFSTLGSTKDKESSFRAGVWAQYLKLTADIGAKQTALVEHLKKTKGGGSAFGVQKLFSEDATALGVLVDELAPFAGDPAELAARLERFMPLAMETGALFTRLAKAFGPFDAQHQFTFHWPGARSTHPLVRVALVLLRIQKLGGTMTADQQRYLKFAEGLLKPELDKHRQDGEAGKF